MKLQQLMRIRTYWKTGLRAVQEVWTHIREAELLLIASSLAYTSILSIIPVLAVSFSIFQAFGGMNKLLQTIEPVILSNLAEGAGETAMESIRRFIANTHAGAVGVGGLVGLILTSMSMLSSIEKAINRVWRAQINRTAFQKFASYWLIVTLGPLALAVALGAATSADVPLNKLFPSGTSFFLLTVGIFFCLYKWVPNRKVHYLSALIAAFITTISWYIARVGYDFYVRKVVTYNKVYGSLGAIPIILLWIYIIWIIILSGAAISTVIQRRYDLR
jgi:membrane protein